jgi:hypothetical protein
VSPSRIGMESNSVTDTAVSKHMTARKDGS